jgi:hypothetical protein
LLLHSCRSFVCILFMIWLVLIEIECDAFFALIRFNEFIVRIKHVRKNEIDLMFIVKSNNEMHIFDHDNFAINMNRDL